MPVLSPDSIRRIINEKIPGGSVIPAHTDKGHFYDVGERRLPSVTGKLQLLKDESLTNWKMNQAVGYVRKHWTSFNAQNVEAHLTNALNMSGETLADAGGIGRLIHDCRERYYTEWIETGVRPMRSVDFVPKDQYDIRAISAMRALEQFVIDWNYVPVVTELLVYDLQSSVAGTLDDIGIMRSKDGKKRELVLCDLKSSNAFKDSYFFQVAMYYDMFKKLTGLKPTRCFILKVSKEDGTYQLEDMKDVMKIVRLSRNLLKVSEGLEEIKAQRKDNQKRVVTL